MANGIASLYVSSPSSLSTNAVRANTSGIAGLYQQSVKPSPSTPSRFGGGIGYTLGNLGSGAFGVLEGIYDFVAGGIAKAAGNEGYARHLMENDISGRMQQDLADWYQPSKGMQFVGDVASGIGQSTVGALAVIGLGAISGGSLAAPVAGLVAGATIGLGAAGKSTAEAYRKTGELGGKEFLYGGASGLLEGALEGLTGAAGKAAAVHEYMHYLEETAPHLLTDYLNQVDKLIEMFPKYKEIADKTTELYRTDERTKNISDKDLRNEIAFKITKHLIDNPVEFNAIVTKDLSIAQRLRLWFRNLLNRLNKTNLTAEKQAVRTALTALETAIKESGNRAEQRQQQVATKLKPIQQYDLKDSIKTLERYSELERSRILANKANLIAERHEDIVEFIKEAQSSNTNKFLYVGKIGEILSQDVNKSTGIKIKGYNIVLNSHYIKHIFKSHGNVNVETSRGQVAVTNDNILNILDTILTPQNVKLDSDKSVVAIIFEKTIGSKHTAVTLLSTGKTRLTLKTAWINKRGGALSPTANDADKSAVSQTPDDGRSTHSTNISISNPTEKSNTFVENSQNIHKEGEKSFSLPDTDSQGRKLTTAQQEYFKDSKMVDGRGRLQTVWHFSDSKNDFTVFDTKNNRLRLLFASTEPGAVLSMNYLTNDRYNSAIEKRIDEYGDTSFYLYGDDITHIVEGDIDTEFELLGQKVKPYYLNAKHPFEKFKNESEFVEFMRFANKPQYTQEMINTYDIYEEDINRIADMSNDEIVDAFYSEIYRPIDEGAYEHRETRVFVDWVKSKGYDAFSILEGDNDSSTNYAFFNPNQIKLTTNQNPTANEDIRFALNDNKENNPYSYKALSQKPDMKVTVFNKKIPLNENGTINRAGLRQQSIQNVREQGNPKNTQDYVYAYCNDTGTDIRVGNRGLKHGLDRRTQDNAKASLIVGELINNAIKINETYSLYSEKNSDYILFSVYKEGSVTFGVTMYIDSMTNELSKLESVDILYSVNSKKIGTVSQSDGAPSINSAPPVPTISISELLQKSNNLFKDIFSKDVYNHFGNEKDTSTKLGSTTKYSLPNAPYKADVITNIYEEVGGKRALVRKEFKDATVTEKDGYYRIKADGKTFKRNIRTSGTIVLGGTAESAKSKVLTSVSKELTAREKLSRSHIKSRANDIYTGLQIAFTNEQAALEKELKRLGYKDTEATVQFVRSAAAAGEHMLFTGQFDYNGTEVGQSLEEIFRPVLKNESYKQDFYYYLYAQHHIDRMKFGKPVLDLTVEHYMNIRYCNAD